MLDPPYFLPLALQASLESHGREALGLPRASTPSAWGPQPPAHAPPAHTEPALRLTNASLVRAWLVAGLATGQFSVSQSAQPSAFARCACIAMLAAFLRSPMRHRCALLRRR